MWICGGEPGISIVSHRSCFFTSPWRGGMCVAGRPGPHRPVPGVCPGSGHSQASGHVLPRCPPPTPPTPSSGSFLNNFRQQLLCSAHCLSLFRPPQSGSLSATDAIPRGSEAGSLGSGCPRSQPLLGHRLLVMSPMAEGQR